jgi:hypothetical protein
MTRPIIFIDTNTVWHRRLAQALAQNGPVIAINPKNGFWPKVHRNCADDLTDVEIGLPRGWASSTAFIGQRILYRQIQREAAAFSQPPLVLLTSPAYAPLARMLAGEFPLVSYTADDYRSYEGWGGDAVAKKERIIHGRAEVSVFVSETLRERAMEEFDLSAERTFVSPNATEERFARRDEQSDVPELNGRSGPVVGILGALTQRLNCDLLAAVAASDKVGTFLVAGPAEASVLSQYAAFSSDKCVVTGYLEHSRMHIYAQALDLALIPYAKGALNRHCSPMRLYDHLATGAPILALSGCDQIDRGDYPGLEAVSEKDFVAKLEAMIADGLPTPIAPRADYFWKFRASALREMLDKAIG